jgi:putative orn/lys/arg decarboxylase
MPTVSCPPAIPIVVSGERVSPAAIELFARYHVKTVAVIRE